MEIMVVVAIIGLITAAVMIQFAGNTRDTQLDEETERINALFDYVREQAELQTRDYGLRISQKTYSFVVYDGLTNQWRPADEDDALRERDFPDDIRPDVVVEGRRIVLAKADDDKEEMELEDFSPQVLIFANGDLSSFELALQRVGTDKKSRIYSDEESHIRMLLPGQVEEKNPVVRTAAAR